MQLYKNLSLSFKVSIKYITHNIITSSSCSFDKAADIQKRILPSSNGVAGKPTPTVAILNLLNSLTVALK